MTAHTSSTEAIRIDQAHPGDAATVRALLIELAEHERSVDAVGATEADWACMLSRPDVLVLLARDGDRAVGYVSAVRTLNLWVGGDILAMDDLYVRAESRDRGVGRDLMAALATHAARDQLLVTWGVGADNLAGHRFYQRLGATLRTKVVASWSPDEYRTLADGRLSR